MIMARPEAKYDITIMDASTGKAYRKMCTEAECLDIMERTIDQCGKRECPDGCSACCGPSPLCETESKRLNTEFNRLGSIGNQLDCEHLKDGKCSVFDKRPLTCRLFGMTDTGMFKCHKRLEAGFTGLMSAQTAEQLFTGYVDMLRDAGISEDTMAELMMECLVHDRATGLMKEVK